MVTTPLEMSTVTSHGEERPLMGQHQKKSDGALTAAAAVAMSVLLEVSSTLSTPLEISTVTSQGEETQPKKQHFEHATGDESGGEPGEERKLMREREEKSDGASTAAAAVAMSALLEKSSMMSTPLELSTATSQAQERHRDEPRRGEAAEETARLQTKRAEQKQGGEQA